MGDEERQQEMVEANKVVEVLKRQQSKFLNELKEK